MAAAVGGGRGAGSLYTRRASLGQWLWPKQLWHPLRGGLNTDASAPTPTLHGALGSGASSRRRLRKADLYIVSKLAWGLVRRRGRASSLANETTFSARWRQASTQRCSGRLACIVCEHKALRQQSAAQATASGLLAEWPCDAWTGRHANSRQLLQCKPPSCPNSIHTSPSDFAGFPRPGPNASTTRTADQCAGQRSCIRTGSPTRRLRQRMPPTQALPSFLCSKAVGKAPISTTHRGSEANPVASQSNIHMARVARFLRIGGPSHATRKKRREEKERRRKEPPK